MLISKIEFTKNNLTTANSINKYYSNTKFLLTRENWSDICKLPLVVRATASETKDLSSLLDWVKPATTNYLT